MDAGTTRIGRVAALRLVGELSEIYAKRGAAPVHLAISMNAPSNDEILKAIIGPTGNLKAPTIRVGASLVVGFREDAYRKVLGLGKSAAASRSRK